jgi:hypothetical protein
VDLAQLLSGCAFFCPLPWHGPELWFDTTRLLQ